MDHLNIRIYYINSCKFSSFFTFLSKFTFPVRSRDSTLPIDSLDTLGPLIPNYHNIYYIYKLLEGYQGHQHFLLILLNPLNLFHGAANPYIVI